MRKYILLICWLFLISVKGLAFSWSGEINPCPGMQCKYNLSYISNQVPYAGMNVVVKLTNGTFVGGGASQTIFVSPSKPSFSVTVIWTGVKTIGMAFESPIGTHALDLFVKNLENVPFDLTSRPTVSGTGTLSACNVVREGLYDIVYKHVGSVNIPYGAEGNTYIKVPPISYPGGNAKTSEYRWKVNGVEVATRGDTYTLSHSKTNHSGTKIVVTARNSCGDYSDSNPIELTVTRNGLSGNETENIINTNITADRFIVATKTINVTNSQVYNNATVEMVAGESIIISPNTIFREGSSMRLWLRSATLRSAELENALDNELDFDDEPFAKSVSHVLSISENNDVEAKLYPNPTNGLVNITGFEDVAKVEVYSVSGQLVDVIKGVEDSFDISHLTDGMYVVRIYTGDGVQTYRVILQK